MAFDQEQPETLWVGPTSDVGDRPSGSGAPRSAGRPLCDRPIRSPAGLSGLLRRGPVADSYRAVGAGSADVVCDGLPTFADGVRAVLITDAVLRSASSHQWEDVEQLPTPNSKEVGP